VHAYVNVCVLRAGAEAFDGTEVDAVLLRCAWRARHCAPAMCTERDAVTAGTCRQNQSADAAVLLMPLTSRAHGEYTRGEAEVLR